MTALIEASANRVSIETLLTTNAAVTYMQDSAQQTLAQALARVRDTAPENMASVAATLAESTTNKGVKYILEHETWLRPLLMDLYDYEAFSNCPDLKSKHMLQMKQYIGVVRISFFLSP